MRAKILLVLSLIFLVNLGCLSQIDMSRHFPVAGDSLHIYKIQYNDLGRLKGNHVLWNIQPATTKDNCHEIDFYTNQEDSSSLLLMMDGTQYRYSTRNDTLKLGGYRNYLSKADYKLPLIECFPILKYDKGFYSYYQCVNLNNGNLVCLNYGKSTQYIRAFGEIQISDETFIDSIYCVRTEREQIGDFYTLQDILSTYSSIDSIQNLSSNEIDSILVEHKNAIRTIINKWYSPHYRYPILETISKGPANEKEKNYFTIAYYCPPVENIAINKHNAERNDGQQNGESGKNRETPINVKYNISFNSDNDELFYEYKIGRSANCSYAIYTINGIQQMSSPLEKIASGIHFGYIKMDSYKKGCYIFVLTVEGKKYTTKFMVD